jgi:hypothetical protein
VPNYDKRLERLEQATFSEAGNMIVLLLKPGEDEAAKVAEAKLEHGLGEDDSAKIIAVQFVEAGGRSCTQLLN